jgi:hypothetical protein
LRYDRRSVGQSVFGLRPDFYFCRAVACLLMWGALSGERTGLLFSISAGLCQRSHSRVRVPWDSPSHFTVSDSRLPFSFLLEFMSHSFDNCRAAGIKVTASNSEQFLCYSVSSFAMIRLQQFLCYSLLTVATEHLVFSNLLPTNGFPLIYIYVCVCVCYRRLRCRLLIYIISRYHNNELPNVNRLHG